jgi:hypothetical protein
MSYTQYGCDNLMKEWASPAFNIAMAPMMDRDSVSVVFNVPSVDGTHFSLGMEFSGVESASQRRVEDVACALNAAFARGVVTANESLQALAEATKEIEAVCKDEALTTAAKVMKIEHILRREK